MTNLDALKSVVDIPGISSNSYDKALIDAGIDGTATYLASSEQTINSAGVKVLKGFLLSSLSEGGYSVSFDRTAIENKITVLEGNEKVRGIRAINI
jgi:hypothetical protein